MSKSLGRRALLGLGGGFGLSALGWGLGCDSGLTTGRRVSYQLQATSDVAELGSVETSLGWRVTLDTATMGLGRMIFVEGAPVAMNQWRALWVPEAAAHPGHYVGGQVFAELLESQLVDLTAPGTLAVVEGTTGAIRSAVVGFHDPAVGTLDPALDDAVVRLAGTAERDGQSIRFTAAADAADVTDAASGFPDISGCPVADAADVEGGILRLEVSVGIWLDRVPFDELTTTEEPAPFVRGEAPHNAFVRGLRKAVAYPTDHLPE